MNIKIQSLEDLQKGEGSWHPDGEDSEELDINDGCGCED